MTAETWDISAVSSELKRLFTRMNADKKPDKSLSNVLHFVSSLPVVEQEDLLAEMLYRTVQCRNIYFLIPVLKGVTKLPDSSVEYMMDELNSALDLLFQFGDLRRVDRLIDMMTPFADQRTSDLLRRHVKYLKEKKIINKIQSLIKKIDKELEIFRKKLDSMKINPLITRYDQWQE